MAGIFFVQHYFLRENCVNMEEAFRVEVPTKKQ